MSGAGMMTKAVRLHGKDDLRLDTFALPPLRDDQILARIVSDSLCMSSYKAARQGAAHKRVPDDVHANPVIIGHEFCGEIIDVGARWAGAFQVGRKFTVQPALNDPDGPVGLLSAPGYSYATLGGDATYVIIPNEVMKQGCLLDFRGDAFFKGSLAEPMSCVVGAFHASYHTTPGSYEHRMGIREGGAMALLAGVGPMGLGAIDYALHGACRPSRLVVTDIDQDRLDRAARIYTVKGAREGGVDLHYVNTSTTPDPVRMLRELNGGDGFDDVLVFAPVNALVEQADALLGYDGCLNFFAGPTDTQFKAPFNFYNVHYGATHVVGTSGGNKDDLVEAIAMMNDGRIDPATMVTHIGGLTAVPETTLNLPSIPGGKKLMYTHLDLDLIALADLRALSERDPWFTALADSVERHNGLWNAEAEAWLLRHGKPV